jgi:DNA-binding NarL/FixJ family response regulator
VNVCVADDHTAIREALADLLRYELGVRGVVQASTGDDVLAVIARDEADLVLMDVNMPGDGVSTTRTIRERRPDVRVVALTAAHDPASVTAMIAAGADSYVVKTATPEELRDSLRRILDGEAVLPTDVLPVVVSGLAEQLYAEQAKAAALHGGNEEAVALVTDQLRSPMSAVTGGLERLLDQWPTLDDDSKLERCRGIRDEAAALERHIAELRGATHLPTKDH